MGTKKPLGISSILTKEEHEERKKLEEAEFKDELYTEGRDYNKDTPKEKKDSKELVDELSRKLHGLEILIFEQSGGGRWGKVRVLLNEIKEGLTELE